MADLAVRFKFVSDCDGHWYMIPSSLSEEFSLWDATALDGAEDEWTGRDFDIYRLAQHPSSYTFADPRIQEK